ncbi:MAG: sigma-70 family RNA polymerase sigma factor [Bacteroidales bacterium]|nr:sigma-70 family RNA polymerase sigma factor [Bacteroidales bacterium]
MKQGGQKEREYMAMLDKCRGLISSLCVVHQNNLDVDYDDIQQDIRANLWLSYESFEGKSSLTTWVYKVALNTIYLHYRRQRYRLRTEHQPTENLNTIADKKDNELTEQLYKLIDQLETDEKTIITMYLERLTQKEIGEVLGLSEDTVNGRIRRIKKKLKELNDHDNGER